MTPTVLRKLVRAARGFEPAWRYGFNLVPALSYRFGSRSSLSTEARRVLGDLNSQGVATTSAEILLESTECYGELMRAIEELEGEAAAKIKSARLTADDHDAVGKKTFNIELLGGRPLLDPMTVYARFALQKPILQIANAYFGMYTRLRYYNVWHTLATRGEARESQLWHYDREDRHILKIFVYFTQVDEGAGPLTYAMGSHPKRKLSHQPECFTEGGVRRSTDEQMAEVISMDRWKKCVGKRGTIVFADTRGYHKGGLARERDRIMYTCMFTSPASQSERLFEVPASIVQPPDRELSFALSTSP